jgi:hypothetical protein
MTRPNGSFQSMGKRSASAPARSLLFVSKSASPTYRICSPSIPGSTSLRKWAASAVSTLPARRSLRPVARAAAIARAAPFSGEKRPRKSR